MRTGILAAGIAASLLLPAPAHAAFPGTNGRIAYQGYQNLGTLNAGGGDRQPLITGPSGVYFGGPTWSANGQRLAFSSNRDGADSEIYVAPANGATVLPLTANASNDDAPAWSPDGGRIAFESDRDAGVSKVWIMQSDGSGAFEGAPSVFADSGPSWSPDGTRIAFSREIAGTGDIWVMNSNGGGAVARTSGGASDTNPDWSPDGSRIVFQREGAGLVTMAANGSDQKPLPVPVDARRPAWSPDGTKIVYDVAPELFVVNANGAGAPSPLTSGGSSTLYSQAPSWQPIPIPAPPSGGGGTPPPPLPGVVDADGDGVAAGLDCNDSNPAIRPGAKDVPGDKIDQDCAGGDAKARLLGRSVVAYTSTYPARRYTTFTTLTVKPVRKGDRLKLTCKGGGCPLKSKKIKVKKNAKQRSLLGYLKHAKLRDGAVMQLRVTRKGTVGRVATWKIRASKPPKVARKCAAPGKKKLTRCPRS